MRTQTNARSRRSRSLVLAVAVAASLTALAAGCGYTYRALPTPASEAPALYPHIITCAAEHNFSVVQNAGAIFVNVDSVTTVSYAADQGVFNMRTVVSGVPRREYASRVAVGDEWGENLYRCALARGHRGEARR